MGKRVCDESFYLFDDVIKINHICFHLIKENYLKVHPHGMYIFNTDYNYLSI